MKRWRPKCENGVRKTSFCDTFSLQNKDIVLITNNSNMFSFLDAQASLAPTQVSLLVRWSYFGHTLVALREKLKKAIPNYFSILV